MNQRTPENPSVLHNYLMNLAVNILNLIVPLLTTPYISRALGPKSLGLYSYCLSIETYFVTLGMLGTPIYAKREISSARFQKEKLNRLFSELWTMQAGFLALCAVAYFIITTIFFDKSYRLMFFLCGIGLAASFFEVSWLYLGLENFAIIVQRGVAFKVIFIALLFLLIKQESDLYRYAMIIMLANFLCNLWLLLSSRKHVKYAPPSFRNVIRHIKPSFFLFLPSMVTSVYAVIDKTMLGAISGNMAEVGFYEQSQKIVTLILTLTTSLGAVLMPRLSLLYSEGKREDFYGYLRKGSSMICFLCMPLEVGCLCVSPNLVPWFFGHGFEKVVKLLMIFSPMLLFMGLNDLIGVQAFLAMRKERLLLTVNIVTTAVNLSLNALLIPRYLAAGAAYATVISEAVKCAIFLTLSRQYISAFFVMKCVLKYGAVSVGMGLGVWKLQTAWLTVPRFTNTLLLTLCGGVLYALILLLIRDQWIMKILNMMISVKRWYRRQDF